jgi:hypothetical protein
MNPNEPIKREQYDYLLASSEVAMRALRGEE